VNFTSLRLPCISWKAQILFARPFFSRVGKRSHAMFVPPHCAVCLRERSNYLTDMCQRKMKPKTIMNPTTLLQDECDGPSRPLVRSRATHRFYQHRVTTLQHLVGKIVFALKLTGKDAAPGRAGSARRRVWNSEARLYPGRLNSPVLGPVDSWDSLSGNRLTGVVPALYSTEYNEFDRSWHFAVRVQGGRIA
jgi:hypothetical protein